MNSVHQSQFRKDSEHQPKNPKLWSVNNVYKSAYGCTYKVDETNGGLK